MQTVRLGASTLEVSRLGLGCMGLAAFYGKPKSAAEVDGTLSAALAAGINFFDTADMYGNGLNETQLSGFVRAHRGQITIATKFANRWTNDGKFVIDNSPAWVRAACEASLQRLGVDVIDLYYMHRRDPNVPLEDSVGAMGDLVKEGKVRYLGLSEVSADTLRQAHAIAPITALQSEYSLNTQDVAAEMLPVCRALNIAFVAYSPLGRGLLTGTYDNGAAFPEGDVRGVFPQFSEGLAANLELVAALKDVAASRGVTPAQIALAFVLAQGLDVVPIPGTTRPERIAENAGAVDVTLSPAEIDTLGAIFAPGRVRGARYHEAGMRNVGR